MGASRLGRLPDSFYKAKSRPARLYPLAPPSGDGCAGEPPHGACAQDDIYKVTAPSPNVVPLWPDKSGTTPFPRPQIFEIARQAHANRMRITVHLFDDQKAVIDRRLQRARENGSSLNRSQVVRALIDGFLDSGIDLSSANDETLLRTMITKRLAARKP